MDVDEAIEQKESVEKELIDEYTEYLQRKMIQNMNIENGDGMIKEKIEEIKSSNFN